MIIDNCGCACGAYLNRDEDPYLAKGNRAFDYVTIQICPRSGHNNYQLSIVNYQLKKHCRAVLFYYNTVVKIGIYSGYGDDYYRQYRKKNG